MGYIAGFALVMSMGIASAFADVTITVSRDSTFTDNGDDTTSINGGRTFTYYKVFSASYGDDFTGNSGKDGGYDADGNPVAPSGDTTHPVSYTASAAVAAKLGSWVAATGTPGQDGYVAAHWEKATGNLWFKLAPIAGSTNFTVEWDNSKTDAETVQDAATWLKTNGVYESTGTGSLTWNASTKTWSATVPEGYYILESGTGDNLIAATTNIDVKEKNSYPPQEKTQADEDNTTKNEETRDVAIGDDLDYDVTVTIPATAKVGDKILVYDKNSVGLTYKADSMAVTNNAKATVGESDYTGEGAVTGAAWQRLITVDEDTVLGSTVVFSFKMTVNASALIDTDKKNESGLKYGPGSGETPWPYESKPDKVEYKTYFAGIHKIDGDTDADLAGVKFALKENGSAFNVTKVGDYYIPGGSSNEVVTDSQGLIMIRGLDEDKTYTLTETATLDGYNMLTSDVTLAEYEDTSATYTQATEYDASATYYNRDGSVAEVADAEAFAAGTFYTKGSETESFSTAAANKTDSKWGEVENNKGTVLPSTGGIGTTIFYVVGSILVVAAGVLLVTKKRMSREG